MPLTAKVAGEGAVLVAPVASRGAEDAGVDRLGVGSQGSRDVGARDEPNLDGVRGPLGNVHTATRSSKGRTEGGGVSVACGAASAVRVTDGAVLRAPVAGHEGLVGLRGVAAVLGRVEGHLVHGLVVDTLHDVDLTTWA
jgi:hypothetical protein